MLPEPRTAPEVSDDELLGGRLRLLQPRHGYRVAIDPVLLAAALPAANGRVLDAGTGTGAAALCLAARVPDCCVVALERDPGHAALARASVRRNGLEERIEVVEGDLLALPAALRRATFDAVMTNPPFNAPCGNAPRSPGRAVAHVEEVAPALWLDACLRRLRPRGLLALIHRADRLHEVLAALHGRAGAITVLPLWPRAGVPARRVVVLARKGARGPLTLAAGLVLHEPDGGFTRCAQAILRHAAPLEPSREPPR
ncbi:methyltransferase [Geminicoccaceae bacterium 1502E]|nr:methyltransferase [Geminicoccaceae bacterium 1502E]